MFRTDSLIYHYKIYFYPSLEHLWFKLQANSKSTGSLTCMHSLIFGDLVRATMGYLAQKKDNLMPVSRNFHWPWMWAKQKYVFKLSNIFPIKWSKSLNDIIPNFHCCNFAVPLHANSLSLHCFPVISQMFLQFSEFHLEILWNAYSFFF